jgi:hypothetical protein
MLGTAFGPWVRAVFTASGTEYFTACIMLKSQKIFEFFQHHATSARSDFSS